jgi:DNA-binding transcriptional MerR regulator
MNSSDGFNDNYYRKLYEENLEKEMKNVNEINHNIERLIKSSFKSGFNEGNKISISNEIYNIIETIVRNLLMNTDMTDNEIYGIVGFGEEKWIEHIKYLREEYEYEEGVKYKGNYLHKTGDVAKILEETPAMIGHYSREFSQYLDLEHTPGQHRFFNEEHVKVLKYIIYLLRNKEMTIEQAKRFLATPQGKEFLATPQGIDLPIIDNGGDKELILMDLIVKEIKASIPDMIRKYIKDIMPETIE